MIWITSASAATTPTPVRKTRATTVVFESQGLKPRSKYTVWCDGVDVTWACRTEGSRMGSDLVSDADGYLRVLYGVELNPTSGSALSPKYTSLVLKDVTGNPRTVTLLRQFLVGK